MELLDQILLSNNIYSVRIQITSSIEEIKKKSPHRTDLIDSMRESEQKLAESYLLSIEIRKQLVMYRDAFYKASADCKRLERELEKEKKKNEELLSLM